MSKNLRIWNSAVCSSDESKDPSPFIESILCSIADSTSINPSSCSLSVLGIPATEKGILSCNPQVPEQYTDGGQKVPFVLDRQAKRSKTSNTAHPLWEAVVSQPASITTFHIDSHGSGHYIRQISGTKVLCACPCTPKNWELMKPYYLQETPLDKCRSSLVLLTVRLAELTQAFEGVTVDILNPGNWIILPPGYIHAVISPLMSSLINISMFRSDWIESTTTGLRRERKFCDRTSGGILELIIGRRERDLGMYKELLENQPQSNQKLQDLIEEETKMIGELRKIRKLQRNLAALKRKDKR